MTLPANIRVNIGAPFPSTVRGSGVITVQKQNGIWTVGLGFINLANVPGGTDPTQVYLLAFNDVNAVFQKISIAALLSNNSPATIITSANSPYTPLSTDTYLKVDTTGGPVEIDMPLAANRNGVSLTIKDYKGNAATNNITIKPQGAPANETIDGFTNAAPLVIDTNYDGVTLRPDTGLYMVNP